MFLENYEHIFIFLEKTCTHILTHMTYMYHSFFYASYHSDIVCLYFQYKYIEYTDFLFSWVKPIYRWLYYHAPLIEPKEPFWNNTISLISNSKKVYSNYETYEIFIEKDWNPLIISKRYDHFYKRYRKMIDNFVTVNTCTLNEFLWVTYYKEKYIYKTCFKNHSILLHNNMVLDFSQDTQSNVKFLLVEYSHPRMNYTICFYFSNGIYQLQNELFTPCFVLHALQYQSEYYVFDMDYILSIVDNNVHTFTLKSHQYIRLEKNNYIIESYSTLG
jgi:hypothetical protein